ncbi:UvrABC system protein C [bacterium HR39]|nr:UvrABC system protein C [bacterium HR39]
MSDAPARESTHPRARGAELIRSLLPTLPDLPGVYRMIGARGEVLYVGKAKSLRRRVAAYARPDALPARLRRMVALTRHMEFVTTGSETEALLLEANLIKRYRPAFNIVLRDDKSFPFIVVDHNHDFPRIGVHRGARRKGCEYFGPFASAGAVRETLNALLRAFPLRNCPDTVFHNRSRPCLQYQIKRCSAPCVGRISKEDYARLVADVRAFLSGRSDAVKARLQREMHAAAEALEFERAAALRDRIRALAHVQSRQGVNARRLHDADVVAVARMAAEACVQVFFYRDGRACGNRAHYPAHVQDSDEGEILAAFLAQFYEAHPAPPLLLLSHEPAERALLARAIAERAGRRVELSVPKRGERRELVAFALDNARQALARRLAEQERQKELLAELAARFGLPAPPRRIEVYDNSHIQGRHAVGAMIVATPEGFDRRAYRTFRVGAEVAGDDCAMLREVLHRRLSKLLREDPEREGGAWPDLLLIDGGAPQLSAARAVLEELKIADLPVVAVAKGPERDAGEERFFLPGREPLALDRHDPVLYYVQRLRDEAHRFAVETHRRSRKKGTLRSALDEIPGVGPRRRRALLDHFGSARAVEQASLRDLEAVPGISRSLARRIYEHFHEGGP